MSCCNQPNYAPVDPCNVPCTPTDNVCYSGPNLPCTGIHTCDTVTVSLQKIDAEVCDLQSQITALQTLVNSLTTTTTTTSTSSTTTTTTTIACPSCEFYSVNNSTITPADIIYYLRLCLYRICCSSTITWCYIRNIRKLPYYNNHYNSYTHNHYDNNISSNNYHYNHCLNN